MFEPSPLLIQQQLALMGSWACGMLEMEAPLEHLARKGLHPEATVTHSFSLAETKGAYDLFDGGATGKAEIE